MCLAIPGKIIEISGEKAITDFQGIQKEVNISLVKVSLGDHIIVHAGFAIERLYPEDTRLNPPV